MGATRLRVVDEMQEDDKKADNLVMAFSVAFIFWDIY